MIDTIYLCIAATNKYIDDCFFLSDDNNLWKTFKGSSIWWHYYDPEKNIILERDIAISRIVRERI